MRMLRDRPAEHVWLTQVEPGQVQAFDDIARAAGLEPLGRAWVEVDADRALQVLCSLLHKDLAYQHEVMPEHRAEWLAGMFLSAFGRFNSRFATNSHEIPGKSPFTWTPATGQTFDAGIAVIGEAGSGIYWVADED